MKKYLLVILFFPLAFAGCKKAVQNAAQDAIMKAMTNGQWVITSFVNNGSDVTTDFSSYKFQYHDNYTVDAIKNGVVEITGSWFGDANTMNISASFATTTNPIALINGTWHITNNSWTYVIATMTVNNETRTLRLDKQ